MGSGTLAIVGGNWNNSTHVGASYANLNNTPGNTNTNIGAAPSCLTHHLSAMLLIVLTPR